MKRMLIALLLLAAASATVHGQDYPTKPVRMVVPFPPGGSNDIVARLRAHRFSIEYRRRQPALPGGQPERTDHLRQGQPRQNQLGLEVEGGPPEKLGAFIKAEADSLSRLIKAGALRVD